MLFAAGKPTTPYATLQCRRRKDFGGVYTFDEVFRQEIAYLDRQMTQSPASRLKALNALFGL
jgi:hypothetical protein